MKRTVVIILALLVSAPVLWAQQPLPITRVLLYRNGMAYIVRSGQLAAPVNLTFHPEDMNDVLKSFTAWNPDTGSLYSVGYTAGIPSSHMLSRFPFDMTRPETGLGGFLLQVKGAGVRLDHVERDVEGTLTAVEQTARVTAPQTTAPDYRLTVLRRDGSLEAVWLSDVRSVELADPQLREQLRAYLDVLAAGRQDVAREISVYPVPAPGPIQVAYLQQFPLWKTSYRIDLGDAQSRIQGWAQIDNPTGEAWENVTVSLLSGAPVSFVMNLYDPLYTNRTTVPVPGGQVAAPRRYESAVVDAASGLVAPEFRAGVPPAPSQLAQGAAGVGRGGRGGGGRLGGAPAAAPAPAPPPPPAVLPALTRAEAAFQSADATRIEDFYEYQFPFAVRIGSRQSALLPFLQKAMTVERLSIFNARTDRGNPRLGARLQNDTDVPFEAGPVTFFQESRYAGEAVLDYLPRGERALVSYGVDHDVQIAAKQDSRPETTARITVSKGVAVLFMESVLTTTYEVRNRGLDAKTLIVEHPRLSNRTLAGADPFESTDSFHRFRVALTPGQATTLPVSEVVARQTRVALRELARPHLALFTGKATPRQVREALGQIVDIQEQIAAMQSDAVATQAGIDSMFRDQERIRENLKALQSGAEDQQLRSRYLAQLTKQEDQIESARARVAAVTADVAEAQARLEDLIGDLAFGE